MSMWYDTCSIYLFLFIAVFRILFYGTDSKTHFKQTQILLCKGSINPFAELVETSFLYDVGSEAAIYPYCIYNLSLYAKDLDDGDDDDVYWRDDSDGDDHDDSD